MMENSPPVIVYDGACPFCQAQVERIRRWAPQGAFEYVPRQQEGLEARFPILAQQDFETGMRLIGTGGGVAVGADAVYEISKRLPATRWLSWLYRVPGIHQIARAAYDWIARNRYRLARKKCEDNVCAR